MIKSIRVEDKSSEVIPKLIKVNQIADRIKHLRELQARIQECKQRIVQNASDIKQQGRCKCNQNVIKRCNIKNHSNAEGADSDIEEIVKEIQGTIKDIRKENFESVSIDN